MAPISSSARSRFWLAFVIYLGFIAYGSLLPFELREYSFSQALEMFANIRHLQLGIASRADWIANILLYIPLAFLGGLAILGFGRSSRFTLPGLAIVLALCLAVAVGLEFTQIFFAPRTVSINDLIAEAIGTGLGIGLWVLGRERLLALWQGFRQGGRQALLAVAIAYAFAYLALSLFPFDFVVSASELQWRLTEGNHGWLLAGNCQNVLRCAAGILGEVLALALLGLLLALAIPGLRERWMFLAGIGLGLVLEGLQLFMASGVSEGLFVPLRGLSLVLGMQLGRWLKQAGAALVASWIQRLIAYLAVPYLVTLMALNNWFSAPWLSLSAILDRVDDIRLLPFYFHYFTTETTAMLSLLAQAAMYTPIGLAFWARQTHRQASASPQTFGWIALTTASIALVIELGKLAVPGQHPDLTNLLIAAGSASLVYAATLWLMLTLAGKTTPTKQESWQENVASPQSLPVREPDRPQPIPAAVPAYVAIAWPRSSPRGRLAAIGAACLLLVGFIHYPVGQLLLLVALSGYAALLWRYPPLLFLGLPALLASLDLSPITGQLMLSTFDLFVLASLAVGYWRFSGFRPRPWPNRLFPWALKLLWLSWGMATLHGLWPLLSGTGVALVSSHSPLQAWLVAKGMLWALLLVPIIRRVPEEVRPAVRQLFLNGLVIGVSIVALIVLWQRHVFVGLGDFASDFRVTGPFASMHTGGAYIEAFIAFAFPALVIWLLQQRRHTTRILGYGLVILTSYALFVTFSRAGYGALLISLVVLALGLWRHQQPRGNNQSFAIVGIALATLLVAIPVLTGSFAQQRLSQSIDDLSFRLQHWQQALALMDDGILAKTFGTGFGQYPSRYLYRADPDRPPGTYAILHDGLSPHLRLGAGETVYLEQVVGIDPAQTHTLTSQLRFSHEQGELSIALCRKALLYSFQCQWTSIAASPNPAAWQWDRQALELSRLESARGWPKPPIKLALLNSGQGHVDIDNMTLLGPEGNNQLANGDFAQGAERWLFLTDQDLAWHIHEQWIELFFAQGMLGVAALVILLVAAGKALMPSLIKGDLLAYGLVSSLAAFLAVGLLSSTMDTARMLMLFYMSALLVPLFLPHLTNNANSH